MASRRQQATETTTALCSLELDDDVDGPSEREGERRSDQSTTVTTADTLEEHCSSDGEEGRAAPVRHCSVPTNLDLLHSILDSPSPSRTLSTDHRKPHRHKVVLITRQAKLICAVLCVIVVDR